MFLDAADAVTLFLKDEYGEASAGEVMIWFDLFSTSQYSSVTGGRTRF